MQAEEQPDRRVVVVWCEAGSEFGSGRRVPAGTGDAWVLTLEGTAERIPASIEPHDLVAIAAFYGADIAVEPPIVDFCVGVIQDGPDVGRQVYAVREIGSITQLDGRCYEVVDVESDPVALRLSAGLGD